MLVTGGLGFIGSNFIRHALKAWPSVAIVNLDCESYGAVPENLADLNGSNRYRFTKGNITDPGSVNALLINAESVVHFAAETHVDRSISNPEVFVSSNIVGTFNLLEGARRCDISKFVHISTDEVYGTARSGHSFEEQSKLTPSNPYAASKAAAEMLVQAYHRTYGLSTLTLRCTNNFGPRQFPEKLIPKTIISALLGRAIPIYGNGSQTRDWTYVEDSCSAIELATLKGEAGDVYNVSAGNELSNLDVVKRILTHLNKPMSLIRFVEDRPAHDTRHRANPTKIRQELGWRPAHTFADALKSTVQWYVENKEWWSNLVSDRILSPTPWKEEW